MATGTEVAWDLGAAGTATDKAFLAERLGAAFVEDDAGTRSLAPSESGPFQGLAGFRFDDGTGTAYDAKFPDVLEPAAGARTVLQYVGGGVAGVARDQGRGRSILLGFPLETVLDGAIRASLMARMLSFCGEPTPVVILAEETDVSEAAGDVSTADGAPEAGDLPGPPDGPTLADSSGDAELPSGELAVDVPETRDSEADGGDVAATELVSVDTAGPDDGGRNGGGCSAGPSASAPFGVVLACMVVAGFLRVRRRSPGAAGAPGVR